MTSQTVTNPLLDHPVFAPIVAEVQSGALGQRIAAYASARSKGGTADALRDLGAPLLDFLMQTLHEEIVSVLATHETVGGDDFDAWFLTIRFTDGLVATVDLGNMLPDSYPNDLELRLELSGTDEVIIAEPENVAVTVISANGTAFDPSYATSYHEAFRGYASSLATQSEQPVMRVIEAARRSAETDAPVAVAISPT